jgi:hypothetical protein
MYYRWLDGKLKTFVRNEFSGSKLRIDWYDNGNLAASELSDCHYSITTTVYYHEDGTVDRLEHY